MWVIRFYSGPYAGKQLSLKAGRNVVGRAPHCEVPLNSEGVSKEHATIEVYNDKIILTDMNSRNGTFVNGVQIKSQKVKPGDRISFHDVVADVSMRSSSKTRSNNQRPSGGVPRQQQPQYSGNVAYDAQPQMGFENQEVQGQEQVYSSSFFAHLQKYVDHVVLPGVYKLPEWMEFRTVIALFVVAFIVSVTALSTIPLIRILKSSIEKESQNRALTIARNLSAANRPALTQNLLTALSVESAMSEAGVERAYIISNVTGDILAPAREAGKTLSDIPFVSGARKGSVETVEQINSSTIGALVPIKFYNSATGVESVTHHAVVIYNMGVLAVDDGRTLALFVEILFIAILLGGLLFFFLYKIILRPVTEMNDQVNSALRDGNSTITTKMLFPELQQLATNINSAIQRGGGGFASQNIQTYEADRSLEMQNLVNLVGFPALAINANDKIVVTANTHFVTGIGQNGNWFSMPIQNILDQALKLNLISLVDKIIAEPNQMATDQLEISSENYDISAQGVQGSKNLAYILVVFIPRGVPQ